MCSTGWCRHRADGPAAWSTRDGELDMLLIKAADSVMRHAPWPIVEQRRKREREGGVLGSRLHYAGSNNEVLTV